MRLLAVHAASNAGDALVVLALSGTLFFSVSTSTARSRVGLYLLFTMAPYSLLSPVVGPFLDRRSGYRRLVALLSCLGRAGICVAVAAHTDSLLLYPAAFLILVFSKAYGVSRQALVPALVGEHQSLVAANARLSKVAIIAGAAAAAPGVLLLRFVGAGAVLRLAFVIFAFGALLAVALPKPERGADEDRSEELAFATPVVRRGARVAAAVRALGGFLLFLLAFGLKRAGTSNVGFGFLLACSGFGAFAASVVVPRLKRGGNESWVILMSLVAGAGASIIAVQSIENGKVALDLIAVAAGVSGAVGAAVRLAFESLVQRECPEAARGRAFARYETLFQLAWVLGAALPVAFSIGLRGGLITTSVFFAVTAVVFVAAMGASGRARLG